MPRKSYTHSAGFNVTSLKGISGIYILNGVNYQEYTGLCEDNWKGRLQAHITYEGQKLTPDVHSMDVLIPNREISHKHLLVLEYLLIWYLRPPRNVPQGLLTHWRYFNWKWSEEEVKYVANERYNLKLTGSVLEFLTTSFDFIRIQREWDDHGRFIKYGEVEALHSKVITCTSKRNCTCFPCLARKRHNKLRR